MDTKTEILKLSPRDNEIAVLAEQYLPLKIAGIDDKEGYTAVHKARMVCVRYRNDIEKKRKALKDEALVFGRAVDGEAKRLQSLLEPVESHLSNEEEAIDAIIEAKKEEARLKAEAEARAKQEAAAAELKRLADEQAAKIKAEQDAENARLKAWHNELARQREEMEAAKRVQKAENDRLEAEQRKLYDAQHAVELERARKESAEAARIETAARMKREAKEAAERKKIAEEKAEAARKRKEAMQPTRKKILNIATTVSFIDVPAPTGGTEEEQDALNEVVRVLDSAETEIKRIAERLA